MVIISIIAQFGDLALILRWNTLLGIGDVTFMLITSTTLYGFSVAFYLLVFQVMIAKITPAHVEASIFSLSQSIMNGIVMLGPLVGAAVNSWTYKIKQDKMDDLYKLIIIQIVMSVISLAYTPLIPKWADIKAVQEDLKAGKI